ncbi:hypothetical protein R6Q59_007402 [Mikania micrantha]|uniref:FAF domain-containing protein n=1 Tax=Mikania micrantha TaxID=192012 RepID=A0A5N6PZG6_9ASTR|nr:hypothetical protein E3N88_00798 [Mikania micrantha]
MTQMQGIVSILRSDNPEKTIKAGSLRRTLSADMSSKKWFADNGLPVIKKIASSEQIAIDSPSSSESEEEECEVAGKGDRNPSRTDIWSAIMSQKKQEDSGNLPPPYVHPLLKKSARSLSEKSLKVCTESLGSETGSDVFSSLQSSEIKVCNESLGSETRPEAFSLSQFTFEKCDDGQDEKEGHEAVKFPCLATRKAQAQIQAKVQHARAFPPPLQSLATAKTDRPSIHMHSRRVNGRLVLEAVSIQQQKYFEAQRQDGRFLLTLINDPKEHEQSSAHNTEPIKKNEDETETDNINNNTNTNTVILKPQPPNPTTPVINAHKSPVLIKRISKRDNEIPSWSQKSEVVEETEPPITRSLAPRPRASGLPPLPPPTSATTINSYQYFWRAKPTVASVIDPLITQHRPPAKTKDLVLLRGNKADCILPSLKGCKEPRRSLLMWEPFCIAT